MELEELRMKIDRIDYESLKLLGNRMELSLRETKLNSEVTDLAREGAVLERIRKQTHGLLRPEFSDKIYREIMGESKSLQAKLDNIQSHFERAQKGTLSEQDIRAINHKLDLLNKDIYKERQDRQRAR